MPHKLETLEIHVGKDGSHRAVHEFAREPNKRGGRMGGDIYMERPPSEEHNFGATPAEHKRLREHIHAALSLGKLGAQESGDGGGVGSEDCE